MRSALGHTVWNSMESSTSDNTESLDLDRYPTAQKLVTRCAEFIKEVQNL